MPEILLYAIKLLLPLALLVGGYFIYRRLTSGKLIHTQISRFFRTDALNLPIAARNLASVDLANVQAAVNRLSASGAGVRTIGYTSTFGFMSKGLNEIVSGKGWFDRTSSGPIRYRQVDTGIGESMSCVENGIHLIQHENGRFAAHVRKDQMLGTLQLEVMAGTPEAGSTFLEHVLSDMAVQNVFRGKILSLEGEATPNGHCREPALSFHALPRVERDDIILDAATWDIIERNTVGFFGHSETLRNAGKSVRRGILLHGKPGTGKTFTIKWLAGEMKGVTVILMSGEQLWLMKQCCQLARMLAPTLVIMEDVDLVATERDESKHPMYQVTLHQLLNEMDGLSLDSPVLFVLTTNRPDVIEPALIARPGRVDQAIEYPLPDDECRMRLIQKYSRGTIARITDLDGLVARTKGASPAFIQEMMRKAALAAAESNSKEGPLLVVTDEHCSEAIRELLYGGGELTRQLLGFESESKKKRPGLRKMIDRILPEE